MPAMLKATFNTASIRVPCERQLYSAGKHADPRRPEQAMQRAGVAVHLSHRWRES